MKILLTFLFALMTGSWFALSATYYVATTGDDSTGDGSIGNPWRNIRYGVLTMAANDTLLIRGGTYGDDGFLLAEFKSGTGANYTRVEAYPSEVVIYKPTVASHGVLFSQKTNIILSGWSIDATDCAYDVVKLQSSNGDLANGSGNIILTNMSFWGIRDAQGVLTSGLVPGLPVLITHCNFYTNGWFDDNGGSPLHQIYVQDSNVTIENCFIYGAMNDNGGTSGVHLSNSGITNVVIRNNYFTNCPASSVILQIGSTGSNVWVYNNIMTGGGYGVQSYSGPQFMYILNNTIVGADAGMHLTSVSNIVIENNIVTGAHGSDSPGIFLDNCGLGMVVRNNLGYDNWHPNSERRTDYRTNLTTEVAYSGNLFAVTQWATNEVYSADFVGQATGNFALQPTSDAVDAGLSQASIFTTDYFGSTRSGTWDIGAIEYQAEPIEPANPTVGTANIGTLILR
jgi:hypothetical protein